MRFHFNPENENIYSISGLKLIDVDIIGVFHSFMFMCFYNTHLQNQYTGTYGNIEGDCIVEYCEVIL